jgi:hypothetical protein
MGIYNQGGAERGGGGGGGGDAPICTSLPFFKVFEIEG